MPERFRDRLSHAWNAFRGIRQYAEPAHSYGMSQGYNASIPRLHITSERTIMSSIMTRIAIDVAAVDVKHVRVGQNGRYEGTISSGLNECLTVSANIDQTGRDFIFDVVMSLFDEGCIAIVPVDTTVDPKVSNSFEIRSLRVGQIVQWYPRHVRLKVYNDRTGLHQEVTLPKETVAIVENPLYYVMNGPNSTLSRLSRKLSLMDVIDEQVGSGKIDILVQLPYVIKTESRRLEAEKRRKSIEDQLVNSKYGIAYVDAAEKVTQLNRPVENNMLSQVEYLTSMLYNQLGASEEVFKGTANEQQMLNYFNMTVSPVLSAITEAMTRTFLTKTARTQGQRIMFFRDPFKLAPVSNVAEIADKLIRNQILTPNEFRAILGFVPDDNPQSDMLQNPNMPVQDQMEGDPQVEEEEEESDEKIDWSNLQ